MSLKRTIKAQVDNFRDICRPEDVMALQSAIKTASVLVTVQIAPGKPSASSWTAW